jgi:hypothetical protein
VLCTFLQCRTRTDQFIVDYGTVDQVVWGQCAAKPLASQLRNPENFIYWVLGEILILHILQKNRANYLSKARRIEAGTWSKAWLQANGKNPQYQNDWYIQAGRFMSRTVVEELRTNVQNAWDQNFPTLLSTYCLQQFCGQGGQWATDYYNYYWGQFNNGQPSLTIDDYYHYRMGQWNQDPANVNIIRTWKNNLIAQYFQGLPKPWL